MDVCRENFFRGDFWLMHPFCRDSTIHTATFHQFGNTFVVSNLYATHLAVASSLPSQYRYLLERGVLRDRDSIDSNTHCFKNGVAMITNFIYGETNNLLLSNSSNITLNFATWLTLLKVRQNHILKGARFVIASCESHSFRKKLSSHIQPSWH